MVAAPLTCAHPIPMVIDTMTGCHALTPGAERGSMRPPRGPPRRTRMRSNSIRPNFWRSRRRTRKHPVASRVPVPGRMLIRLAVAYAGRSCSRPPRKRHQHLPASARWASARCQPPERQAALLVGELRCFRRQRRSRRLRCPLGDHQRGRLAMGLPSEGSCTDARCQQQGNEAA